MKVKKFKDFINENQINLIKKMVLNVVRYYGDKNKFTYELRGGTWFSLKGDDKAHRYNQVSELGGTNMVEGLVRYKNPAVIGPLSSALMLFDIFAFTRIPFFTERDKDVLFDMCDFKTKQKFLNVLKNYLGLDKNTFIYKTIKQIKSLFVIHAIITDLILAKRLNETDYDILIRVDEDLNIFEIFDFKKLFIEI